MAAREEIERLMTLAGKLSALGIDKAGCLQEMIDLQQRLAAELAALRAVAEAAPDLCRWARVCAATLADERPEMAGSTMSWAAKVGAALDKAREAGG